MVSKCCCFKIETGGVIIATWNAAQMLFIICYLLIIVPYTISYHFDNVIVFVGFVLLIISVAIFCISLLSIKGIETRNHKFILPMLIWLFIAFIVQLIILGYIFIVTDDDYRIHFLPPLFLYPYSILLMILTALSITVFYYVFKLFKNESGPAQEGLTHLQKFLPTTRRNDESHLENVL